MEIFQLNKQFQVKIFWGVPSCEMNGDFMIDMKMGRNEQKYQKEQIGHFLVKIYNFLPVKISWGVT